MQSHKKYILAFEVHIKTTTLNCAFFFTDFRALLWFSCTTEIAMMSNIAHWLSDYINFNGGLEFAHLVGHDVAFAIHTYYL